MMQIGFIGLGHMGLPMAENLVKAGHKVYGYDLNELVLKQFESTGGIVGVDLPTIAQHCEVLITMLQNGSQVLTVSNALFQKFNPRKLYIDCSTIDVVSAREVHKAAQEHQVLMVDAPVSGGTKGAAAGTLTFMVGGLEEAFAQAQPILALMGKNIIHTGGPGSGQAAKICNNMVLGMNMIAVSEAFALAKQLDLEPLKLFDVVNNSSGQCWALTHYVPEPGILTHVPSSNNYQPGFTATMMLKDLKLSQDCAHAVHLDTPLAAQATALYQQFVDEGCGNLDFSAIIKMLSSKSEV
ncbi:MAG: 3-hydroxyisobutyrate dehydrogenase [Legionella sp. 40-6]|mgnify:FL=1|nr:3-hydroxyisobutyrate dehydrogenase [Legionella sp.]OJY40155.1 MAG: 3-hydroxyisobutyrate dehydrogenase [Legionella sp. 40-6]